MEFPYLYLVKYFIMYHINGKSASFAIVKLQELSLGWLYVVFPIDVAIRRPLLSFLALLAVCINFHFVYHLAYIFPVLTPTAPSTFFLVNVVIILNMKKF